MKELEEQFPIESSGSVLATAGLQRYGLALGPLLSLAEGAVGKDQLETSAADSYNPAYKRSQWS